MLLREGRKPEIAEGILAAVKAGMEMKPEDMPKVDPAEDQPQVNGALADLLRVLLKAKSESLGVAPRLIASSADLDAIASGGREVEALSGLAARGVRRRRAAAVQGRSRAVGQGQRDPHRPTLYGEAAAPRTCQSRATR